MKTAIIDRSLSGLEFKDNIGKTDTYMYAQSLLEAGTDYVEIDLQALVRLPEPTGAENYIFRLSHAEEYRIANALPFAYALLPLKFSYLIDKIDVPVILEIKTGDADIFALLKVVSESIDLTQIEMLRLVGEFRKSPDELHTIITKIKMMYAIPIDMCPVNTNLGALSVAVAAYYAGIDALTLNFGNSSVFTPLEEFFISMATIYKKIICKSYISGICKAAVMSALISKLETLNLKMLMRRYRFCPQRVEQADGNPAQRHPNFKKMKKRSFTERRLDELEVDEELSEEIIEKLRKYGMDSYTREKKDSCLN